MGAEEGEGVEEISWGKLRCGAEEPLEVTEGLEEESRTGGSVEEGELTEDETCGGDRDKARGKAV